MKTSRSLQSDHDLRSAEAASTPFSHLRFRSVRSALRWYFERTESLSSPQGMHPRGERAADGSMVMVRVQGGKGGDFDGVLATMTTIGAGMAKLKAHCQVWHQVVVLCERDGWNHRQIAEKFGWSMGKISAWRGQGEAFLAGLWSQEVLATTRRGRC